MMKKNFFNSKESAIDDASAAKSEWQEVSEWGFCGFLRQSRRHSPSLMRKLTPVNHSLQQAWTESRSSHPCADAPSHRPALPSDGA
jgi:hypothetical protein